MSESVLGKPLGEICKEIYRYPTYYGITYVAEGVPEVRGELILDDGEIELDRSKWRFIEEVTATKFPRTVLDANDLVLSVRGTIGKVGLIPELLQGANITANLIRIAPYKKVVEPRFLWHFMRTDHFQAALNHVASSTTIKTVRAPDLKAILIPLPPLEEQRRIAAILDKADAVLRKRKEAIALTEELLRSAFLELFGDPVTNLKRWEAITLSQIVKGEMRNGLSPSTSGTYKGQVLTLSAITQGRFNAAERKTAEFDVYPPKNKMIQKADLLVCRGNGNINLVGCARFPDTDYDDIMFPDTMIAVPINFSIIHKTYLEMLWNGQSIRRQIEQQARTTNGTHKINQKVLNDIQILLPPMALQEKFGVLYNTVKAVSVRFRDSAYNNLFNSFLQRAFCGKI